MRSRAKPRLITSILIAGSFLGPVFSSPHLARADDTDLKNDARLEAYGKGAATDAGTAVYYMLAGGLGIVGLSVMFKDAKRSHLD